jgi:hypothetical protein
VDWNGKQLAEAGVSDIQSLLLLCFRKGISSFLKETAKKFSILDQALGAACQKRKLLLFPCIFLDREAGHNSVGAD